MIEKKYQPQAQRAADLLYTALVAIETCGADVELTNLVVALSTHRFTLQRLFGLDASQVKKVIYPEEIYPLTGHKR